MNALERFLPFLKKAEQPTNKQGQLTAADPYPLDKPLLYFSPFDSFTIRDSTSGVLAIGETGSGKTSGAGAEIAKAYLRAGFGGLWCCAKPEDRDLIEQYAGKTGRQKSLRIFSPDNHLRFNFLEYELTREGKGSGQTENLVNLFSIVTELVEGKIEVGGDGAYWTRGAKELNRNAIDLLALAGERLTVEAIARLIASAPQSLEDVGTPMSAEEVAALPADYEQPVQVARWWSTSYCAMCIGKASDKLKTATAREKHDFEMSARYWLKTYAALADRTRSGIVSTWSGVADMLLHGIAWELLCTETNIVPEATYKEGAIIVLDLPIQEFGETGRIIQGIWKYMFVRTILRRDVKCYQRPVFLFMDEAQNFVNSFDFQALAVARSARLCHVYLTQNVNGLYGVLGGGGRGESQANALMANLTTKIFHSNSDPATNRYAAEIIGQEWTTAMNFSASSAESSHNSQSSGGGEVVQYKVLPQAFSNLRKGGPANNLAVDAILYQGGRVFKATGENYIKVVFKQG